MINRIHKALHNPETGWDPVPAEHAAFYGPFAWEHVNDESPIDWIESLFGSVRGKKVLDLGAGPGQYSVAFARRGADVTWHDVSAAHRSFASRKAEDAGVAVSFSLGYLESAERFGESQFDIVFCRSCWCYSVSDKPFARLILKLVKPGGCVFINTLLSGGENAPSAPRRLQRLLYEGFGLKLGHPVPPAGRMAALFRQLQTEELQTRSIDEKHEEEILFRKSRIGS